MYGEGEGEGRDFPTKGHCSSKRRFGYGFNSARAFSIVISEQPSDLTRGLGTSYNFLSEVHVHSQSYNAEVTVVHIFEVYITNHEKNCTCY
jgi:hypothetical protein